jgi:iron complex outermembrane receptor protein
MKCWALVVLSAPLLCAQQSQPSAGPPNPLPPVAQSVVVTGTAEPIPLAEADRDVSVTSMPAEQRPLYNSWFDLLQLEDPELDLQQRAPGGFLADLSVRGATFGQTLVLLNGMRINDVQTGHFNLDLPIPFEMITSMEVLKGSGSTLYGSDAVGGVVNVLTRQAGQPEFRILAGAGNFGFNQEHVITSFGGSWWQSELAAARDFSTGFISDRDYRNLSLSTLDTLKSKLGATTLLFAYSDRPYGADQFYGPYDSWERIKTWYGSVQQDLGQNTQADFSYRRHTDLFVLFRDNPSFYTNRHLEDTFVGDLRRHDNLPLHGVLSYGVQGLSESISSTNLGIHSRMRASGYVFYDLRSVKRYSLSAGIREEVYGAHQVATSPSLSGAAWLSGKFKMRAAVTRAFRLPSFTDLYYSDPANLGNPNLKPESAMTYEAGVDAYFTSKLHAGATVFQRRDTNLIDYVRANANQPYQAENFDKLRFTGVETSVVYDLRTDQHFSVSFGGLQGINQSPELLQSKYALFYPVQNGILEWRGNVFGKVVARTRIGVVNRISQNPYAIWDASAGYTAGRVRPYLQLTNLMNADYQEIQGVVMPGRGIIGGLEIWLRGGSK